MCIGRIPYLLSLPGSSVTAVTGTVTVPFSAAATAVNRALHQCGTIKSIIPPFKISFSSIKAQESDEILI